MQYQIDQYGSPIFRNGHMLPFGVSLVRETTVFREFGPVAGNTFKVTFSGSPPLGDEWLNRRTLDVDLRHYQRLMANGVFAMRVKMFRSWGPHPDFLYFGGNSEMRGYEYLQFLGHKAFFANVELRYPLINAMLTPLGVLGGLRGVMFFNIGGTGFNGQPFNSFDTGTDGVPAPARLRPRPGSARAGVRPAGPGQRPAAGRQLTRRTASASRLKSWASPSTSTGPGRRSSTRLYEDVIFFYPALATRPERVHERAASSSAR